MNDINLIKVEFETSDWLKIDTWMAGDVEASVLKRKVRRLYLFLAFSLLVSAGLIYFGVKTVGINFVFIYIAIMFSYTSFTVFRKIMKETKSMIRNNRAICFYITNNTDCTKLPFYPELERDGKEFTIISLVDGYVACETNDLSFVNDYIYYHTDSPIFWAKYHELLKLYEKVNS